MDRILRLNEFFVEGGKQNTSHVLLHITEPSTPEEMNKGYFFAIAEINNAESKYVTRLHELIDQAENDYYELSDENDKTSLELVLEKMNQEALGLAKTNIELNCIVGAIRQPEIIFTYYGKPQMVLFYKNQQGLYQKMDLIQSNEESESEPVQLFSHIIQGKISPNDFMFAGTPHIAEYFSHDRLQKIITTRPAVQSSQHIERVLSEIKNGFSFGGLIMHIDRADSGPIPIRKATPMVKGASSKSLHSLFDREKTTAHTLAPSFLPRLNERIRLLLARKEMVEDVGTIEEERPVGTTEINASHVSHRQSQPSTPNKIKEPLANKLSTALDFSFDLLKLIGKGLWAITYILYSLIYGLLRNLILLVFVATNYQKRRQAIIDDWRRSWRAYKENIYHLPTITKVLVVASLAITGIFIGSLTYLHYHQKEADRQKAFTTTVQQIKAKKDAMESALIYKDDSAALKELASASGLLSALTCTTKDEQQTCSDLKKQLEDITARIRKITQINPDMLHDWNVNTSLENIVKVGTKLVAFSKSTSTLFVYDTLTKENKVVFTLPTISGFTKASVPKENDYVALLYNNKDILLFNPEDYSSRVADVSYNNPKVTITDIVVYNRRLYSLDTLNSQIYRHDSIKNGFSQGKDWIKDGTSIKNGEALTIDGDMFVLQDGKLIKFTSGVSQAFDAEGIDPAIGTGSSLWTYTDLNTIYILDPKNERVVILNKEGLLKQQIKANGITKPTGMAIDAQSNIAYIIASNKLFKVQLPQ